MRNLTRRLRARLSAILATPLVAALVLSSGGVTAAAAGAPFAQPGVKLTSPDGNLSSMFGYSVAMSGDGSTALVGAPSIGFGVGRAWVFTHSGSGWTAQGPMLTPSDASSLPEFGYSVAISNDGNTALIGGPGDNNYIGAAWVFTRSNGSWTQQSKLTGTGELSQGEFGNAVALSADGNTALIGAHYDDRTVTAAGAAWVFTRAGSSWSQQGSKLTGSGEVGQGQFGYSVALSADGNTGLVGANADNGTKGAVWAFTRSASVWSQQGPELLANDELGGGQFGYSIGLSADGSLAVIGGPYEWGHMPATTEVGAAWAFALSGGVWSQLGTKFASEKPGYTTVGWSVSLSGDGNTVVLGAPDIGGQNVGGAWEYMRSGSIWNQVGGMITGNGETGNGQFGWSVALSSDGSTAMIGARADNSYAGAVWAFGSPAVTDTTPPTVTLTGEPSNPTNNNQATFSWTITDPDNTTGFQSLCSLDGGSAGICTSPTTYSGLSDGQHTFTVNATDPAGNRSADVTYNFLVDTTPPTITASAITTGDGKSYSGGTWTKQDVRVSFSCTDSGSGVNPATVTPPVTLATEGQDQSATGSCADMAGNSASTTFAHIDIDKTPPVTTATILPGAPVGGLPMTVTANVTVNPGNVAFATTCYNAAGLNVVLSATDNLSGVASIRWGVAPIVAGQPLPNPALSNTISGSSGTVPFTTSGAYVLNYAAVDVAGNQEATQSRVIYVNSAAGVSCATTPVVLASLPPTGTLTVSGTLRIGPFNIPFSFSFSY